MGKHQKKKKPGNGETLEDPIRTYFNGAGSYPANGDDLTQSLYPDANDSDDRVSERFFYKDVEANSSGTSEAPIGHYIIDALERGSSRLSAIQKSESEAPSTSGMITVSSLPTDTTPGGASVVAQYAGRVWYSGFSGEVIGGDSKSPRMSSYILFSKVVNDTTDIGKCYQVGDPTSRNTPDILDTDGGFIRIDSAYGIKVMWPIENSLFVLAQNGVWRILGDDGSVFRATSYSVEKVSDRGIRGPKSVVEVEGSLIYWGDDGIYQLGKNQFGDWVNTSITERRIQNFYNKIGTVEKSLVQGYYDSYDKKARWVYETEIGSTNYVKELVLDKNLNAFYKNTIYTLSEGDRYPKVVGIYETNPFRVSPGTDQVTVSGDFVQVGGDDVIVNTTVRDSTTRQLSYIIVTAKDPTVKYSFGNYSNTKFRDWESLDGVGADAYAYLLTGYITGGTFQREKQVTNLTAFIRKTEDGFTASGDDYVVKNPSSCKVQYQWDWTNDINAGRWSKEREYYRPRRWYATTSLDDTYNDGQTVVAGKDKVRGKGKALSIKFSTSPDKDLVLYGWSMVTGIQSNV